MAKQLQLRRGTTAQHASFTGLVGEVTVDTDTDQLRVHDGSTANGIIQGVPLGGIIAIASGITNAYTLPSTGAMGVGGWQLCDGASIPGAATLSGSVPTLNDGRFLQGNTHGNVGGTGGAASVTLSTGNLAAHTHTGAAHTHTGAAHTHTSAAHTHTGASHNHGGDSHSHTVNSHSHGGGSHRHDSGGATANADRTAAHRFGSSGWTSGKWYTDYPGHGYEYTSWSGYASATTNTTAPGTNSASGTTGSTTPGAGGSTTPGATGSTTPGASASTTPGAGGSTGSGSSFAIVPTYLRVVYVIRVA